VGVAGPAKWEAIPVQRINPAGPPNVYFIVSGAVLMGSREIDLEEADPQKDEQGGSLARFRVNPASHQVPGFRGVSDHDAVRLSAFAQSDLAAVCRIVVALCGSEIDVDGAVAEAIARAVEQLGAGRSIDALSAWITRVAVNVGRSENRRQAVRRRKAPVVSLLAHTDAGIDSVALRVDMQHALRNLTRRQAEVVALYYGLDLSVADVARTLGRSEGTVKATLFKARSILARSLGSIGEDDDDGTT
jgi:RNA polymerase sigma-70 factor, ECF subfamily